MLLVSTVFAATFLGEPSLLHHTGVRCGAARMAFYPVSTHKVKTPLRKALRKPNGALTVSVEYMPPSTDAEVQPIDAGEVQGDGRRTVALSADERLAKLSGELRGGREGALASAIWTSDLESLRVLVDEQSTAKGDFPMPCPVVWHGDAAHAEAAVAAGASGVVLRADEMERGTALDAEIVWDVSSTEEIERVVDNEAVPEDVFLLDEKKMATLAPTLPAKAVVVAALDAMQHDDGEIIAGRELASSAGCKAVLLRRACVGDVEDVPYAKFAIKSLTSKKSSSFAIDGHTGAVNGHFGGVRATAASPEGGWERMKGEAQ